jgi:hypothetical protein
MRAKSNRIIGYIVWHNEAERRDQAGEKQIRCAQCDLWVYPQWPEDIADHNARTGLRFEPKN